MISLFLIIAACQAEIAADVELYQDLLNDNWFHVAKVRSQRSSIVASIGKEAELKLYKSGAKNEATVSLKF